MAAFEHEDRGVWVVNRLWWCGWEWRWLWIGYLGIFFWGLIIGIIWMHVWWDVGQWMRRDLLALFFEQCRVESVLGWVWGIVVLYGAEDVVKGAGVKKWWDFWTLRAIRIMACFFGLWRMGWMLLLLLLGQGSFEFIALTCRHVSHLFYNSIIYNTKNIFFQILIQLFFLHDFNLK